MTIANNPCLHLILFIFILFGSVECLVTSARESERVLRYKPNQGHFYRRSLSSSSTTAMYSYNSSSMEVDSNHRIHHKHVSAPLYITIGPQGCGKTTLLKQISPNLRDICLDDQPDVYVPVPTRLLLLNSTSNLSPGDQRLCNQSYHGKTLGQRIQEDNLELKTVLQRCTGQLSPQNFAVLIYQLYQDQNKQSEVGQLLVKTVEEFLTLPQITSMQFPNDTQIFILESLFQPYPGTSQSGIQRALQLLKEAPRHIPIAWGNTNSKPRDYQMALDIASQTKRPVKFVLCHPQNNVTKNNSTGNLAIPWQPLETLLQRNLLRWLETGKYIPASAIAESCQRIQTTIPPFATAETLVSLANGGRHTPPQTPPPYQFAMTSKGMIQKIFDNKNIYGRNSNRNENNHHFSNGNNRNQNQNKLWKGQKRQASPPRSVKRAKRSEEPPSSSHQQWSCNRQHQHQENLQKKSNGWGYQPIDTTN